MQPYYKIYTARAPVNIAVIKYWGKRNEEYKLPINDSLSGTLNVGDMCATTSVAISNTFQLDELWLNGKRQDLSEKSNAKILLEEVRRLAQDKKMTDYKAHIVSYNNFPTAAGLASSAAGYACLAFVLGHAYGVTDLTLLSRLARRGSGSACRSLFGGFVQWDRGLDQNSSQARQIVNHKHWPDLKVIICVISDTQKDVSSSEGMKRSVETSDLIKYRADTVVPRRIETMTSAIMERNFEKFADITMRESNQFHAICLDTYPPLFYMNDASRHVIKVCSIINSYFGCNKVAYTFDAGPNACIYLLDDFIDQFIGVLKHVFPPVGSDGNNHELLVKGKSRVNPNQSETETICEMLREAGLKKMPNSLSYLISTSIGDGPQLTDEHLSDKNLNP